MRANAGIFIIICLLFLGGTAEAAGIPTTATVSTSPSWVIANGVSQSTITVTVYDDMSAALSGVPVNLALNNSVYGTLINASPLITNSDGQAVSTFRTKTKSGAALITATIPGYPAVTGSVIQNIDHDIPYYDPSFPIPLFEYPAQGEVAKEVDVKISMHDQWGNPIDNRTGTDHVVTLYVNGPDPDDCGFNTGSGYDHTFSPALNGDGNLTVKVLLTSKTGTNYVHMGEIKPGIIYQTIMINAIGSGVPVFMTGTISNGGLLPNNNELLANNIDRFTLDYHLYDRYGNVMANESVWMNTNITGEQTPRLYTADATGLIRFYYGPSPDVRTANVTAVAADNASVNTTITAHFLADVATNMVLVITPPTINSHEYVSSSQAYVRATVVDLLGNPVEGETVNFELGAWTGYTCNNCTGASLDATTATTNEYGDAVVHLTPGSFPALHEPEYKARANASVVVVARWTPEAGSEISKTASVTWKNYPLINVQTSASQVTGLNVNDTVDITIDVIGNGFVTEGGGQIATIIDMDSSSTMWSNGDIPPSNPPPGWACDNPSKCVRQDSAKAAAKWFAIELLTPAPTGNWVGINSFGNLKKDDYRLMNPQTDLGLVNDKIDNLVPGNNAQGFGQSLVEAIQNLSETQEQRDPDKLRAVIVLKDSGGGNLYNNQPPTDQDVIREAGLTEPPTLIFTVYYYDGKTEDANAIDVLRSIANETHGKFYRAENSDELVLVFVQIANYLKYAAGVDNQLSLNFQNVEVNGNKTSNTYSEVFSYVPVPDFWGLRTDGATQDSITSRTRIMWPNATNSARNQSVEFAATHKLAFNDIGVVNISEQWNATFRIKINQSGILNLFNCSMSPSTDIYKEPYGAFRTLTLCLPDLYLHVNTPASTEAGNLDVSDLIPQSGSYTNSVPLQWNLRYKGFDEVTERYYFAYNPANLAPDNSNLIYHNFDTVTATGILKNGDINPRSTSLNLNGFYQGPYAIKVVASAPGMPSDTAYGRFTIPYPGENGAINIQLK